MSNSNGYNQDVIRSFAGADNVTHLRAKDHTVLELAQIKNDLGQGQVIVLHVDDENLPKISKEKN
tara:strand:- start:192 stop:386 length:195 start_codon:yes stop_codon:yes gene_type:complete